MTLNVQNVHCWPTYSTVHTCGSFVVVFHSVVNGFLR